MNKRKSPYVYLRDVCKQWAWVVVYPQKRLMWCYDKDELDTAWGMSELSHRVQAADQLGYDVKLRWDDAHGLQVWYVKRPGDPPMEIRS